MRSLFFLSNSKLSLHFARIQLCLDLVTENDHLAAYITQYSTRDTEAMT